jgi:hypothetical protein
MSLNQHLPSIDKSIIDVFDPLGSDDTICDSLLDDTYGDCGSNISYNPITKTMIYSPNINFVAVPGLLDTIISFFASLFSAFRTSKSVYNVFNASANYSSFDKIYMMNKGAKSIKGIAGLVEPGGDPAPVYKYYIAVNYTGFTNTNVCDAVYAIDYDSRENVNITCTSNFVSIDVPGTGSNPSFFEDVWLELTARVRP